MKRLAGTPPGLIRGFKDRNIRWRKGESLGKLLPVCFN